MVISMSDLRSDPTQQFSASIRSSPEALTSIWRRVVEHERASERSDGDTSNARVGETGPNDTSALLPWSPVLGKLATMGGKYDLDWALSYEKIHADKIDTGRAAQHAWDNASTPTERRVAALRLYRHRGWCKQLEILEPEELGGLLVEADRPYGVETLRADTVLTALSTLAPVERLDAAGRVALAGGPVDEEALRVWLAGPGAQGGDYLARNGQWDHGYLSLISEPPPQDEPSIDHWALTEALRGPAAPGWLAQYSDRALAQFHRTCAPLSDDLADWERYAKLATLGKPLEGKRPTGHLREVTRLSFLDAPGTVRPVFQAMDLGRLLSHLESLAQIPSTLGLECWEGWRWAAELWASRVIEESEEDIPSLLQELDWPRLFLARELVLRSVHVEQGWRWAEAAVGQAVDFEQDGLVQAFWSCLEAHAARGRPSLRRAIRSIPPRMMATLIENTPAAMVFTNHGCGEVGGVGWVLYAAAQMKARLQEEERGE